MTVHEIKTEILDKLSTELTTPEPEHLYNPHEYVLKVIGVDEYIDIDKQQLPLYPFQLF